MCTHKFICQEAELVQIIRTQWPSVHFKQHFALFYEGQVPNIAAYLVGGAARTTRGSEEILVNSPVLLGIDELFYKNSSSHTLTIEAGAEVSIFDRVSLMYYLEKDPSLMKLLAS